jgi:capsular polysaccharide biosynthesis protein
LAKIEEIKNIQIVNILDPARAPLRKERPKRATNTVLMFLLTFFGVSGYYTTKSVYGERIRAFLSSLKLSKNK